MVLKLMKKRSADSLLAYQAPPAEQLEFEYYSVKETSAALARASEIKFHADPAHKSKNRYSNVLPIEDTRVKVQKENTPGSIDTDDYINANYVYDVEGEAETSQRYICCQAPLNNTMGDFWLMIWQHKSPLIVMLTRLTEKNENKAEKYWPEFGEVCFGSMSVRFLEATSSPNGIVIRKFVVRHQEQDEPLEVTQLQYTEWPDFGVPTSTAVMIELMDEVNKRKGVSDVPICVHCSAGIGRTGTFIAIQMTLEKHKSAPFAAIDVMKTVLNLRKQRYGMVQSPEQYKFVYNTIQDVLFGRYNPLGFQEKRKSLTKTTEVFPYASSIIVNTTENNCTFSDDSNNNNNSSNSNDSSNSVKNNDNDDDDGDDYWSFAHSPKKVKHDDAMVAF